MITFQQILDTVLPLFPNATFSEEYDGCLVIHTNVANPGDDPDIFMDMGVGMFIIVYGDAVDGLSFFGPFSEDDYSAVCDEWAMTADGPWTVAPLEPMPK